MIDFGELSKNSVHVGIGNGRYIEVPMLGVGDYAHITRLQRHLADLNSAKDTTDTQRIDAIIEARSKLAEYAAKVMPPELHDNLRRMEFQRLLSLVNALCTGDDNSEEDTPEKKVTLPSQMPAK